MGRTTQLLHWTSFDINEHFDECPANNMKFWNISDDILLPLGCDGKWGKTQWLRFENYEQAKSSKKFKKKFKDFPENFCFVSESAIEELVGVIKQAIDKDYCVLFIINDSQTACEYLYTITGGYNNARIKIMIEIKETSGINNIFDTEIIKLFYD